jgi:hypothetical protein
MMFFVRTPDIFLKYASFFWCITAKCINAMQVANETLAQDILYLSVHALISHESLTFSFSISNKLSKCIDESNIQYSGCTIYNRTLLGTCRVFWARLIHKKASELLADH